MNGYLKRVVNGVINIIVSRLVNGVVNGVLKGVVNGIVIGVVLEVRGYLVLKMGENGFVKFKVCYVLDEVRVDIEVW